MSTSASVAFAVLSTILLFAALRLPPSFRDDSVRLLKKMYFSAGEFRQKQWNGLLDVVGDDPAFLWSYGSWTVVLVTYAVVGGIYTLVDLTAKPEFLRKYKVQPGTNEPLTFKALSKVLPSILFNLVVVTLPAAIFLGDRAAKRGTPPVRELPPFHVSVLHIIAFVLLEEIGFYYSHRLFHHRLIYKYFHKKHHEWTAPVSIVAVYAHPLEHLLSNIMPAFLGIFLLNSHVFTGWLWLGLAIAFTLSEHSGYHLPFFPSSEAHDFHHLKFTNCYGVLGVLDWLHGTDVEFRKTRSFPRHRILKGFQSARELFPDSVAENTLREKTE